MPTSDAEVFIEYYLRDAELANELSVVRDTIVVCGGTVSILEQFSGGALDRQAQIDAAKASLERAERRKPELVREKYDLWEEARERFLGRSALVTPASRQNNYDFPITNIGTRNQVAGTIVDLPSHTASSVGFQLESTGITIFRKRQIQQGHFVAVTTNDFEGRKSTRPLVSVEFLDSKNQIKE